MSTKKSFTDLAKDSLTQASPLPSLEDHGMRRDVMVGTKRVDQARIIPIDKIDLDPNQPRDAIDEDSPEFKEFIASIANDGLIQALTVEFLHQTGRYLLIAGERRLRAARALQFTEVPCFIKENVKASDRYALQLVENIHREDLNPVQKARGLINLKKVLETEAQTEVPWHVVETRLGVSEERRKQLVGLLKLPEQIQKTIVVLGRRPAVNGEITEKHARALGKLNHDPEKQLKLFHRIRNDDDGISGDRAMELAKAMLQPPQRHDARTHRRFIIEYTTKKDLLKKLEQEVKRIRTELRAGGT